MSTPTKGTKKKAPTKATVNLDLSPSADPFMFDIDPKLQAKIEAEGLVARWINRSKYIDQRGDHRGWRPYQVPKEKTESKGALDFQYGIDPDGYVSRGDLVLAVRPVEMHEVNKRRVARKTSALLGYQTQAAKNLSEVTGMKVHEGYEDEVKGYKSIASEDLGDDE